MPYVEISNANVYYDEIGVGEPIVFLHNAFSRGIIAFSAQFAALQSKYRCIFPDLRGQDCGHGPHLIGEKPELLNEMILNFLDKNNIENT
ncbi:alpha/beta fold hydrolase [Clostridium aciditolerans]|uniref:Alpha/beta hydrolase n=1 Tax=Clostridium aciditolerans TaxID=339861 RepID=A0A934M6B6_9CLOT|nr:hypothetical protein [Clostridium aciditolerans]MBI6874408.1 hypothetical protein [Clostridium aciditolerans]